MIPGSRKVSRGGSQGRRKRQRRLQKEQVCSGTTGLLGWEPAEKHTERAWEGPCRALGKQVGRSLLQLGHELPGPLVRLHYLQAGCHQDLAPEMSKGKVKP